MNLKTSAHYQREYRQRLRDLGLVKKEVWILPENSELLSSCEAKLRESGASLDNLLNRMESNMENRPVWSTTDLLSKLQMLNDTSVELMDGANVSLHITMQQYGDLPVFLSISGNQIIIESVLWMKSDLVNVPEFNEMVLKTHKLFPLSTISLDKTPANEEYYCMFGALSASSSYEDIVLEIQTLAENVIQATQAYSDFLKK